MKAVRALQEADVVAHFAKRGNPSNARAIVVAHARPEWIELPLLYPVTTEIDKDHADYKTQIFEFYKDVGGRSGGASRRPAERSRYFPRAIRFSTDPICICTSASRTASRPR